jgi:hypothetical protein
VHAENNRNYPEKGFLQFIHWGKYIDRTGRPYHSSKVMIEKLLVGSKGTVTYK